MPRRLVAAHHECHVRPRRKSQKSGADLVEGRTSPYRGFPQLQLRLTSTTARFWAYAWSVLLQHICKQCSGLSMSLQVYFYSAIFSNWTVCLDLNDAGGVASFLVLLKARRVCVFRIANLSDTIQVHANRECTDTGNGEYWRSWSSKVQ